MLRVDLGERRGQASAALGELVDADRLEGGALARVVEERPVD